MLGGPCLCAQPPTSTSASSCTCPGLALSPRPSPALHLELLRNLRRVCGRVERVVAGGGHPGVRPVAAVQGGVAKLTVQHGAGGEGAVRGTDIRRKGGAACLEGMEGRVEWGRRSNNG